MLTIVTVMYGTNPLYELELFGSVLSALSLEADSSIDITVFTDRNLDSFPLPINVVQFDKELWNKWTFNGEATHFVNMHVMLKMLCEHKCPVLYFDTDMIFLRPPSELAKNITEQSTLMHAYEGPISEHALLNDVVNHIKNNNSAFSQQITPTSPMYNSGIMGMLPEHAEYMEQAIEFAKELYQFKPIFSIDQFATATVLSSLTQLKTCEPQVLHYWGWKRKFIHIELESIRNKWLHANMTYQPDFESLANLPTTHIMDNLAARLKYIFHREAENPRFAYLAFLSARRIGLKNQGMSQAWLATCLEAINNILNISYNEQRKPYSVNDFSYLFSLIHNTPSWLNSQNLEEIKKIERKLF